MRWCDQLQYQSSLRWLLTFCSPSLRLRTSSRGRRRSETHNTAVVCTCIYTHTFCHLPEQPATCKEWRTYQMWTSISCQRVRVLYTRNRSHGWYDYITFKKKITWRRSMIIVRVFYFKTCQPLSTFPIPSDADVLNTDYCWSAEVNVQFSTCSTRGR